MILAEFFIRIEYSSVTNFDALARKLDEEAVELAKRIYSTGVQLDFDLQEGSLKERAKVIGKPIAVVVGLVAGYHELRESVIDIYNDAQKFSHYAKEQFLKATHSDESAIRYKRELPTDINRLHRIIENADSIEKLDLSKSDQKLISEKIASDIAGLSGSNPGDPGVQLLLENLPTKRIPDLPKRIATAVRVVERRRKERKEEVYGSSYDRSSSPLRSAKPPRRYRNKTDI